MQQLKVEYDVIVVGGGPIGLSAAYQCAKHHGKKVLVLEQFGDFAGAHGSSPGFSRQFRVCYSEENLCKLALIASEEWDRLMTEMNDFTLMQRTGTLWFGDAGAGGSGSSSEGNINKAIENLGKFGIVPEVMTDKEEMKAKFPFVFAAVKDIENPKALFVSDGGTVNVPAVVKCLKEAINKCKGCRLMKNAGVTCIDYTNEEKICVTTNDGTIHHGQKVILTPGTYVNNVLSTLKPEFPKFINFDIYLWVSAYFRMQRAPNPHPTAWPTWYFFGNAKSETEPIDHNLYYGFPVEHPTPKYVRVCPAFISEQLYYYHLFPKHVKDRPLDQSALKFTSDFVQNAMPDLDPLPVDETVSNCVAGFVSRPEDEKNSGGIVLDFLPNTNKRIVLTAGGWCMKYVPVMGIILAKMALLGEAGGDYKCLIKPMKITQGILLDKEAKSKVLTSLQIKEKCRKLWL